MSLTFTRTAGLFAILAAMLGACSQGQSGTPGEAPSASLLELPRHESSQLTEYVISGKDAELRSPGAIDVGTALVLSASSGGFEYALYRFNLGADQPDSVSVVLEEPQTTGAWIGLANYAAGRWDFSGPFTAQKTLLSDDPKYTSPAGNIWVAVVAREQDVTVNALSVRTLRPDNVAPNAAVQATPDNGNAPLTVQFDSSASSDSDGSILEYAWDFDGNGTYEEFSDGPFVSHDYLTAGLRTVKLRVMDDQLARSTATVDVDVNVFGNQAPIADLGSDVTSGDGPLEVSFDASASSDDIGIARFDWDFDGDGNWDIFDGQPAVTHSYDPGSYVAQVRVTDDVGAQSIDSLDIDVNAPPLAALRALPDNGDPGDTIQLLGYESDDPDGTLEYHWDLDGSPGYELDTGTVDHAPLVLPATPQAYRVKLMVVDDKGSSSTSSLLIPVHGWASSSVESSINLSNPKLLVCTDGTLLIFYADSLSGVMYVRRSGAGDGASWTNSLALASSVSAHISPSLVNGYPALAYNGNSTLKYLRSDDVQGRFWGPAVTPDGTANVGQFPSLAVVNGTPAISYYANGTGDLKYVHAQDADGASWASSISVETSNDTGKYTSLLSVQGNPAIAYYRVTATDMYYIRATTPQGSAWSAAVAVEAGAFDAGSYCSMALVDGRPAVSYSSSPGVLRFARSTDDLGGAWTAATPDTFNRGFWTSLAVIGGKPAISYQDYAVAGSFKLRFVQAMDAAGTTWGTPSVLSGSAGVDTGYATNLTEVQGGPGIACYNDSGNSIEYFHLY